MSAGVDDVIGRHGNGQDVFTQFLVVPGVTLDSLAVDAGQRHLVNNDLDHFKVKRQMNLTPVVGHCTAQCVAAAAKQQKTN